MALNTSDSDGPAMAVTDLSRRGNISPYSIAKYKLNFFFNLKLASSATAATGLAQ